MLASLELVLRRQGENAELAEILAREAEVAADPMQQADFLAALGEVRLAALEDADGALAAYRDAIDRNAEHPRARAALIALLDRSETREGALDVLEPLAQARGDFDELLALYERRLELHDDRAERAHWLRKMAEVAAEQLGSPEKALEALGRALKEEPMPGAALDDLERIAGAAKLAAAGAAKIEAALADADPDSARELALRAAPALQRRQRSDVGRAAVPAGAGGRSGERRRAAGAGGAVSRPRATISGWRRSWPRAPRRSWIRRRGGRG